MQKKNLIITIVVVLILIGLSFSYGYFLKGKILSLQEKSKLVELEKSKLIQSWIVTVTGKIIKISERTLTLSAEEESLVILIKEDAKIISFSLPEPPAEFVEGAPLETQEKEIKFEDLKVGDKVSIIAEVKPGGELEGTNVSVLSAL